MFALPNPIQIRPALTIPVISDLSFGPARTTRGWQFSLDALDCARHQPFEASYEETRGHATLSHQYTGRIGACKVSSAGDGAITVVRQGAVTMQAYVASAGKPKVTHLRLSKHCSATLTTIPLTASGTILSSLHSAAFGTLSTTRLPGDLQRDVIPACALSGGTGEVQTGGPTLKNVTLLLADRGIHELDGVGAPGIPGTATFSEAANDGPAGMESDQFGLAVTGKGTFHVVPGLKTATLDFASPVSHGILTFTAGTGCPSGVQASDGHIGGSLSITDPVLGTVTVAGRQFGQAILARGTSGISQCSPSIF